MEYRNATAGLNPWKTASQQLLLVVALAAAFVSPLYFESRHMAVTRLVELPYGNGSNYRVSNKVVDNCQENSEKVLLNYPEVYSGYRVA